MSNVDAASDIQLDDIQQLLESLDEQISYTSTSGLPTTGSSAVTQSPHGLFQRLQRHNLENPMRKFIDRLETTLQAATLPADLALDYVEKERVTDASQTLADIQKEWYPVPSHVEIKERESRAERNHLVEELRDMFAVSRTSANGIAAPTAFSLLLQSYDGLLKQRLQLDAQSGDLQHLRGTGVINLYKEMNRSLGHSLDLAFRKFSGDHRVIAGKYADTIRLVEAIRNGPGRRGMDLLLESQVRRFSDKYARLLDNMSIPIQRLGIALKHQTDTSDLWDRVRTIVETNRLVDEELAKIQEGSTDARTWSDANKIFLGIAGKLQKLVEVKSERAQRDHLRAYRMCAVLQEETQIALQALTRQTLEQAYDMSTTWMTELTDNVNQLQDVYTTRSTSLTQMSAQVMASLGSLRQRLVGASEHGSEIVLNADLTLSRILTLNEALRDVRAVHQQVNWMMDTGQA